MNGLSGYPPRFRIVDAPRIAFRHLIKGLSIAVFLKTGFNGTSG
jgi:hypothetical protein